MSTDKVNALPFIPGVNDDHPPTVPFSLNIDSDSAFTYEFPKSIYIRDKNGRYLSVRKDPIYTTLTFRQGEPDLNCVFQPIYHWYKKYNMYHFRGNNQNYIMRYTTGNGWYSCDARNEGAVFHIITASENYVYLKDDYSPSNFLSCDETESGGPRGFPYINNSSRFEISPAAVKYEIFDVNYNISGAKIRDAPPIIALSTNVTNDSDGPVNQTLTYTYEKSKSGTWNNTAGITVGVKVSFEAGVPFVAEGKYEVSVSASYTHQWGGQVGERRMITSTTMVTVPPKKKARAIVIIRNAYLDVEFTYRERILWSNGEQEEREKKGIYKNVDSWFTDVKLDDWKDT